MKATPKHLTGVTSRTWIKAVRVIELILSSRNPHPAMDRFSSPGLVAPEYLRPLLVGPISVLVRLPETIDLMLLGQR
jgi:hypothetical protein